MSFLSNSRILTSNFFEISINVSKSGCAVFVHHFDTVEGLTFNCSESHLLVLPFSTIDLDSPYTLIFLDTNIVIYIQLKSYF